MSNFFLGDRIKETSRVQGTNNISLDGAAAGFSSFSDFYASGDTVFYAVTDNSKYEVGSGVYFMDGSTRSITRNPIRSSNIQVGPYFVDGTSNSGPTSGRSGKFYPLWLTRSAAISGVGIDGGPFTDPSGLTFDEYPGVTFYQITERANLDVDGIVVGDVVGASGGDFSASGQPVNFVPGVKEVFVTYPGKTAVYQGYGLEPNTKEPKQSGLAFWVNEQILNYSSDIVFDDSQGYLGIGQSSPEYAIDIAGNLDNTAAIRASGFIEGGSGIMFSGGQLTDTFLTASGGKQYEPFRRNRVGSSSNGIINLSGVVDQIIEFGNQTAGTFFAGPSADCDPCTDAPPTFRQLEFKDLPSDIADNIGAVIQKNKGLDTTSENVAGRLFKDGMVAIYAGSGSITYDSGIYYDATNNRLQIGGDASSTSAAYNLHVRGGDLAANSGHFNQILFLDSNYRIGNFTGTNSDTYTENFANIFLGVNAGQLSSGNFGGTFIGKQAAYKLDQTSGVIAIGIEALASGDLNDYSVFIGPHVGMFASGVDESVILGYNAGWGIKDANKLVAIGPNAGSGVEHYDTAVLIGDDAGVESSGITNVVGIGTNALKGASGIIRSYLIGNRPASGSFDFEQVAGFGGFVVGEASGLRDVVALGQHAGRYGESLKDVFAIGSSAAQSGLELNDTVAVGRKAASEASGNFNIYLGYRAGVAVSGNENIELIASGASASFFTHEASGKINIGNTIAGDIYNSRIGIGDLDNASPSGTLFIRPLDENEPAFVLQHKGSGSATPYMVLQSGDGTTIYHITNSGDVISSGFMNPSGGLRLGDHVPDSIVNKLYNNGGTLYWNGTQVDTAGATTLKVANDTEIPADASTTWTDGQLATFSGVDGCEVTQVGRFFKFGALELSGVLQPQISSNDYAFKVASSGEAAAIAGNDPFLMTQTDVAVPPVIVVSGISGVNVDSFRLQDGTNNSGILVVGYEPTITYQFSLTNGEFANDPIVNNDIVTVSGVSGVHAAYDPATNYFRIGASGLSGVLYNTIIDSGQYLRGQILENTTSGVAISGIATWASGEFGRIGVGTQGASGLILKDEFYIMDPNGSGHLSVLELNNSDNIIIQPDIEALYQTLPVDRGDVDNAYDSIFMGRLAGYGSRDESTTVALGHNAGMFNKGDDSRDFAAGTKIWGSLDNADIPEMLIRSSIDNVQLGANVAISADGSIVAASMRYAYWASASERSAMPVTENDISSQGAVAVFKIKKPEDGYSLASKGAELVKILYGDNALNRNDQVALSADGRTLVVGRTHGSSSTGQSQVQVYYWNDTDDVTNGPYTLQKTFAGTDASFGYAVTVSADGNVIAFRSNSTNKVKIAFRNTYAPSTFAGSANWTEVDQTIIGTSDVGDLALSSDGRVLAVQPGFVSTTKGAAILDINPALQTVTERINDATTFTDGYAIALNADGSIIAIGNSQVSSSTGEVKVYKSNESGEFVQLGSTITATNGATASYFGYDVDISDDGKTIVVGEYVWQYSGQQTGRVHTFRWNGSDWEDLNPTVDQSMATSWSSDLAGNGTNTRFGSSVALTSDGKTLVVGATADNTEDSSVSVWSLLNHDIGGSVHIGNLAGHMASGSAQAVNIGYNAGALLEESPRVISIGNNASIASSYNRRSIAIGDSAFSASSGSKDSIAVGTSAAKQTWDSPNSISIGTAANKHSFNGDDTISVGREAGAYTQNSKQSIYMGLQAGLSASGNNEASIGIGTYALADSYYTANCVAIGRNAAYAASGSESVSDGSNQKINFVAIGTSAARESHQLDHSVMLGSYAGFKMDGNRNSILIRNQSEEPTRDCGWAPKDTPGILNIGDHICGIISPLDTRTNLHIGKPLPDHGADENEVLQTINNAVLNITPPDGNDAHIRLKVAADIATPTTASVIQVEPMFVAETYTDRQSNGNAKNTEDVVEYTKNSGRNIIVNNFGYLTLPTATTKVGSSDNFQLKDARGAIISKEIGAVCLVFPALNPHGSGPTMAFAAVDGDGVGWYMFNPITGDYELVNT